MLEAGHSGLNMAKFNEAIFKGNIAVRRAISGVKEMIADMNKAGVVVEVNSLLPSGQGVRIVRAPSGSNPREASTMVLDTADSIEQPLCLESVVVRADRVGTFKITRDDGSIIVNTGDRVNEGNVMGRITYLRNLSDDVVACASGIIGDDLLSDGTPVGYGDQLVTIKLTSEAT